jgi:hypothetical protein
MDPWARQAPGSQYRCGTIPAVRRLSGRSPEPGRSRSERCAAFRVYRAKRRSRRTERRCQRRQPEGSNWMRKAVSDSRPTSAGRRPPQVPIVGHRPRPAVVAVRDLRGAVLLNVGMRCRHQAAGPRRLATSSSRRSAARSLSRPGAFFWRINSSRLNTGTARPAMSIGEIESLRSSKRSRRPMNPRTSSGPALVISNMWPPARMSFSSWRMTWRCSR